MATAALVVGAVSAIVGTGLSVFSTIQQSKAQKKARREQESEARRQARRQRRRIIREQRIRRAESLNVGTQVGATGSSSLAGGLGSLSSQAAGRVQGVNAQEEFSLTMSGLNQRMANAQLLGQIGQGAARFGSALVRNRQQIGQFAEEELGIA